MIAPWSESPLCHPQVFQLGLQSLALWPALLEELTQDTGIRVAYGQGGSVLVAHPADKGELLQFGRSLRQHGGWPGGRTDSVQPLQAGELQALEPALNPQLLAGFWLPQETHIDNRALLVVLQQTGTTGGRCVSFQSSGGHVAGRTGPGRRISGSTVAVRAHGRICRRCARCAARCCGWTAPR